jgi:predicted DNA-binding antitoxin AbrB/MazE fold protein
MRVIAAVYENGVFRPIEPVDLPDGCQVTVEPRSVAEPEGLSPHQRRIHELLRQPVDTADPGLAERHDEHQP